MKIKSNVEQFVLFGSVKLGEVFKTVVRSDSFYMKTSESKGMHNCVELRSGKTAVCTIDSKVYVYKNATLELNE